LNKEDIYNPDNYPTFSEYFKAMTKIFNLDNPAPYFSARSWIMMNLKTREIMYAKNQNQQRQVASLTKVMTFCVIINIIEKYHLDPHRIFVNILESSTTPNLGGTSAQLQAGDKMSVYELYYGMMLPSGNDAAQSLAIYFGNLMLKLGSSTRKEAVNQIDANIYPEDYPEDDQQKNELQQEEAKAENIAIQDKDDETCDKQSNVTSPKQ